MTAARALDQFFVSVQVRALRMAELALRSPDDALDAVQEAMMHLARAYSGRPAEEWGALFYRILENKIRDQQRRMMARGKVIADTDKRGSDAEDSPSLEDLTADDSVPDAAHRLITQESMQRLLSAIGDLPVRQRQAFTLRVWEGLSTEDTAKAMGCTDGSVKTHLSRALLYLRSKLSDVWEPST